MSQVPSAPLPGLGSLSQAARRKQLRGARAILVVVGVLSIFGNILFAVLVRESVDSELEKALNKQGASRVEMDPGKYAQLRESVLRIAYLVNGAGAGLGVVFIVLGVLVYKRPVAVTVTGLVLYVAANLAFGLVDPTTVLSGAIVKIIIVLALLKSITTAIAYQKAQVVLAPVPGQGG